MRMLLGFRSRWTTPAEWTYFNPRCQLSENDLERRSAQLLTYEDLVEEVLDELLLERSRSQEAVEIGSQELSHEVAVAVSVLVSQAGGGETYISSRGEMKISLKLMICEWRSVLRHHDPSHGEVDPRSHVGDA